MIEMTENYSVPVALIVAMDENGVIGRNNALPWHLPEDLRYFRRMTMGKPVVMGRKTWESIGKPLSGRANIVVSRDASYHADGATCFTSLDRALAHADSVAMIDGAKEIMVMGGAQLYQQALSQASVLYLTRVHAQVDGDAVLSLDLSDWQQISDERHEPSDENPFAYSFQCYYRDPA